MATRPEPSRVNHHAVVAICGELAVPFHSYCILRLDVKLGYSRETEWLIDKLFGMC